MNTSPIQVIDQIKISFRINILFLIADMYNSYYQPFVPQTVTDYDAATRYNANYGLISYDSSYMSYPSTSIMPTTSFTYMNENYPSTQ